MGTHLPPHVYLCRGPTSARAGCESRPGAPWAAPAARSAGSSSPPLQGGREVAKAASCSSMTTIDGSIAAITCRAVMGSGPGTFWNPCAPSSRCSNSAAPSLSLRARLACARGPWVGRSERVGSESNRCASAGFFPVDLIAHESQVVDLLARVETLPARRARRDHQVVPGLPGANRRSGEIQHARDRSDAEERKPSVRHLARIPSRHRSLTTVGDNSLLNASSTPLWPCTCPVAGVARSSR